MIEIVVGTDRLGSRSELVAQWLLEKYKRLNVAAQIFKLADVQLWNLRPEHYAEPKPDSVAQGVERLLEATGLHMVVPEYNGSMPGALKHFIDHWKYPDSFEHRPVAFVGLGGLFGGLRPVEHLQQVFGYRNSFLYPDRVFLCNIWNLIKEDRLTDGTLDQLLTQQTEGFSRFIRALNNEGLST